MNATVVVAIDTVISGSPFVVVATVIFVADQCINIHTTTSNTDF